MPRCTLLALTHLGYYDEARAFRDWLIHAVAGAPVQMQQHKGAKDEIPRKTVDCRAARRMTKKLESPIPWWSAQSHYTCNSVFAGLQQLAYRIGNSALPLVRGHRSDFRKGTIMTFLSAEWTPSRPKGSAYNVTQDQERLG